MPQLSEIELKKQISSGDLHACIFYTEAKNIL